MKEPIATEQVLSPLGHRIAVKYHYEDGTSREVKLEGRRTPQEIKTTLEKIIKKCNQNNCKK